MKLIIVFVALAGIVQAQPTTERSSTTITANPTTERSSTTPNSNSATNELATPTSTTTSDTTTEQVEEVYVRATRCDWDECKLPNCRCSDTTLDDNIPVQRTPQFVTVTFDDAVTVINHGQITEAFKGLVNPDGCGAKATFFVSHDYTDYTKLHDLWADNHEIALHSVTHGPDTTYWKEASVETIMQEFGEEIDLLEKFAKIDRSDIKGGRLPFFEMSGNNSYIAFKKLNLTYDSSWPTQSFRSPGLWPYTMDYASTQDCPLGNCPDVSLPGLWVNPLVDWEDVKGYTCVMTDACIYLPPDNVDEMIEWMKMNFNNHYNGNRAPFGIYLHSAWFTKGKSFYEAFKGFLRYLNSRPDVFLVTSSQVIDYMRNPRPGMPFDSCPRPKKSTCKKRVCQLRKVDSDTERWMTSCAPCPSVYPWLNNPLGLAQQAV